MQFNNHSTSVKPGLLLFLISAIISVCIFRDYGMAWDEEWQRRIGAVSYAYIFNGDHQLDTFFDRDHGTGFELLLTAIEKLMGTSDLKVIYQTRHLLTNLFYLLGAFCGYVLALRLYKKQLLACLCFFMLAFMPQLYAHSYFNTKDIPFMVMCTIFFMVSRWAFDRNKPLAYLVLGLAGGYATSIRLLGILPFAVIIVFMLADCIIALTRKEGFLKSIFSLLLFIAGFCAACYTFWPTLWVHPVDSLVKVFDSLAHYAFSGNMLLNGKIYYSMDLPWFYIPVWLLVSLPIVWMITGVAGFLLIISLFFKKPLLYTYNTPQRQALLHAGCFVPPIVFLIVTHSVIYDSWRHVFFIYPGFVFTALFLLNKLLDTKWGKIVWVPFAIQAVLLIIFMVLNHPFQNIYFNEFLSRDKDYIGERFELDYWGTSFKPALEYIVAHDTSSTIMLNDKECVILNKELLPEKDRKRIVICPSDSCLDYDLEIHRAGPLHHPKDANTIDIVSFHNTLTRITRLKKTN